SFISFSFTPPPPTPTLFPYTTLFRSVLLYIAFGQPFVNSILPLDFKKVGAVGVLLSLLTGTGALLFGAPFLTQAFARVHLPIFGDRKSTRLNSSHVKISYAVFCLKKK